MNEEKSTTDRDANPDFFVADFSDLVTCRQRVTAFCRWFELPDPGLRCDEDGDILVDEVFLRWCKEEGISIDWLACGDPKGMAVRFREVQQGRNKIEPKIARLNEQEIRAIEISMKAYIKGLAPMEQAIRAAEKALKEVKEEAA